MPRRHKPRPKQLPNGTRRLGTRAKRACPVSLAAKRSVIRAGRSRSRRGRLRGRSGRAGGSRPSTRSRASRATGSFTKKRKRGGRRAVCVPYSRLSRRPARCGGCRSSRSSCRKRFSSPVDTRAAYFTNCFSIRSSSRSTPRPVFAETAMSGGRWRSRAASRGRTSSMPTMPTSHFARTTIVAHIALRATSATARSWSTTPSDTSTSTSATSARSAASSARSSE